MLQGSEIIIILLVALIVLGPQRLPDVARKVGRWSTELREAARELRSGLEAEVGDLAQLRSEIEKPITEIRRDLTDLDRDIDQAGAEVRRLPWVGPQPKSGPTPADALADLDEIEGGTRDERREG